MKKITLNVKGMHCSACEMLIKEALQDAGAKSVSISHKSGVAEAEYDESKISEDKLKKAIESEGYKVD